LYVDELNDDDDDDGIMQKVMLDFWLLCRTDP